MGRGEGTNVVCAGELLEHLEGHAQCDAVCHAWRLQHHYKFLDGALLIMLLSAELRFDLFEFCVHGVVMSWGAEDFDHGVFGFIDAAVAVVVAGGVGEKEDAHAEDYEVGPAYAEDDAP